MRQRLHRFVFAKSLSYVYVRDTGKKDYVSGSGALYVLAGDTFKAKKFCYLTFSFSMHTFNENSAAGNNFSGINSGYGHTPQEIVVAEIENLSGHLAFTRPVT